MTSAFHFSGQGEYGAPVWAGLWQNLLPWRALPRLSLQLACISLVWWFGFIPMKTRLSISFQVTGDTAEVRDACLIFRSIIDFLMISPPPLCSFSWVKFRGAVHQPLQAACQRLPAEIRTNTALPLLAGEGNLSLLYLEDSHQGLVAPGSNLMLQPENALQILLAGDWCFLVSLWMLKWCDNKPIRSI